MKEISFKLVDKQPNKQYFECSIPLMKTVKGESIKEIMDSCRQRANEKYKKYIVDTDGGCRYICISDAYTHIERLVFISFRTNKGFKHDLYQIAGKWTFMTEGGTPDNVYEPSEYFKQLAEANGYIYKELK